MMYEVRFSPRAQRDLRSLTAQAVQRLLPRIEALASEPRPQGAKKLSGDKNVWRILIGNYRAVYTVDDGILVVYVRRIGDRKDIYL